MIRNPHLILALLLAVGVGCSSTSRCAGHRGLISSQQRQDASLALALTNSVAPGGDIVSTRLEVDVSRHTARAVVEVIPGPGGAVVLEAGGLQIRNVAGPEGQLPYRFEGGRLSLTLPSSSNAFEITIDYEFCEAADYQGVMERGMVFTWPYYCGNLFPCHSHPSDGARFELSLTGVPEGETAIYPRSIPSEAPSYMVSWAIGRYSRLDLGTTSAGTRVGVWYLPGQQTAAERGSLHLRDIFDWLERTYGPYPYGDEVAGVEVAWDPGAFGGMEHHPFWHMSPRSLDIETTQAHEAVHGWFGNSVRIRCWEDLVLSEGTASYIAARVVAEVVGQEAGARVWEGYERRLESAMSRCAILVARPPTCGEIDVVEDGLFCSIPYMKGAFFLRAVAERIGPEVLDQALAAFYRGNRGQAAGMDDLIGTIIATTGYDPTVCADAWLRQEAIPTDRRCPAP